MGIGAPDRRAASWLVCRAGGRLCALPLDGVREAMRPLPIDTMAHAPAFVLGLSIIRGTPVPVVDAGLLAGERPVVPGRYVTVEVGGRMLALAVETVLGVRTIDAEILGALPPLLDDAPNEVVSAIGTLDKELTLFLSTARILSDQAFADLAASGAAG